MTEGLFHPPQTFMGVPAGLPGPGCRAAVLGVPFDCGTHPFRVGARAPEMMSVGLHLRLAGHPSRAAVSCGPSSGDPAWPSRQAFGLLDNVPICETASNSPKVHQ